MHPLEWLKVPRNLVRASTWMLYASLISWPATHVLMVITHPPDAKSWVFHFVIGLSWMAIVFSLLVLVVTTEIRDPESGPDPESKPEPD